MFVSCKIDCEFFSSPLNSSCSHVWVLILYGLRHGRLRHTNWPGRMQRFLCEHESRWRYSVQEPHAYLQFEVRNIKYIHTIYSTCKHKHIHTYIHTKQWRGLFHCSHYIKYFSYFLWCILRTYIQYISSSVWYVRKYIHTYIQYVTHIDTYTRLFGYLFRSVHTYNHFYMHSFIT